MKRLRLLFFVLGAFIFWTPGFSSPFDPPSIKEDFLLPQDSLLKDYTSKPLADSQKIEEMTERLRPMLFSNFGDFTLEKWYANKPVWIAQFGDRESILYVANILYEKYIAENRLLDAAKVKNAIGRIYSSDGEYSKAIEESQVAYALAQRIEDPTEIGWNLTCISNNFFRAFDPKPAMEYAQRALDISRQHKNHEIEVTVLIVMGGIESELLEYEDALATVKEALAIAKANDLTFLEKKATLNITYIYNRLERYNETITFLDENIDFSGLSASFVDIFLCYNLFGAYLGKGDYDKATSYLDMGCTIANEIELKYAILSCYEYQTKLYETQGLYQQALEASMKTQEVQAELTGIEQTQAIQSLKTRLALLEKDLEIEKLDQAQKESRRNYSQRTKRYVYTILFLIFFMPALYVFMRNQNRVKSAEQQREIAEAKIQVLQSQMHPHFIFNALSGIQNYILKSEKIEAYNYLGKFATLLRTLTKTFTQAHINLDQEIEFIRSYLEIEKLRFRESFVYSISLSPDLVGLTSMIPRMIIQPVVENALIHGITGLDRQGVIEITIKTADNQKGICCTVTDNGRGREAAAEQAKEQGERGHLSIATANTSKRINFLRRLGYEEVDITIEDLYNGNEAIGTKVCLYLPYLHDGLIS